MASDSNESISTNYKTFIQILLICSISNYFAYVQAKYLEDNYPKKVIEDAHLDTAQLIEKYKYPIETHYVTTNDNYILRLHRIANPKAPPILFMHGLVDSSATWVLMGPNKAPAYYFFDNGYDVWLGNSRGNRYSRNHTTLDPNTDQEFWKFSWHEIGFYDLPIIIDHILKETGFKKIAYFGHSQGTTAFWVLCSLQPQYNEKITVMHALAPVAYLKHIKTPLIKHFREFAKASKDRVREFLPRNVMMFQMCFISQMTENMCIQFLNQLMGNDGEQTNSTMYPVIFGHVPAGCNLKQFDHYLQIVKNDRFCQYDYEREENMKRYNHSIPPVYPLEKVIVPVGLHYTYNDYLSSDIDVKRLAEKLPNVVENVLYPYKTWNHISMLWGVDARRLAHERMLKLLKKYPFE
ncbi:lipase 1-like [Lucilia cuprina]|uniref:lipase 1-like n=1 Tax=Lucilia cuprina TaxID=7375 RepID=UPI001F05FEF0|nr:lipase 1-like [Lucilia cuprina]